LENNFPTFPKLIKAIINRLQPEREGCPTEKVSIISIAKVESCPAVAIDSPVPAATTIWECRESARNELESKLEKLLLGRKWVPWGARYREVFMSSNVHKRATLAPENKETRTYSFVLTSSLDKLGTHENDTCGVSSFKFWQENGPIVIVCGVLASRFVPNIVIEDIPSSLGTWGDILDKTGASYANLTSVIWLLFIVTTTSSPVLAPDWCAGIAHLNKTKLVTDAQLDDVEPITMLAPEGKKFFPEIVIEPPPRVFLELYKTPSKTGLS
jgi:hypothetical protein